MVLSNGADARLWQLPYVDGAKVRTFAEWCNTQK